MLIYFRTFDSLKEVIIMTTSRIKIDEFKNNPAKAIEQLEFCGYECQGGIMINNVAFIALKELILEEER